MKYVSFADDGVHQIGITYSETVLIGFRRCNLAQNFYTNRQIGTG